MSEVEELRKERDELRDALRGFLWMLDVGILDRSVPTETLDQTRALLRWTIKVQKLAEGRE